LVVALIGGLSTPLYALCTAHTNDYLNPSQMVAASGALVLTAAVGSSLGAPIAALAMDLVGPDGFFHTIAGAMALLCLYAIWRSLRRDAVAVEEMGDFVALAPTPMSAVMNPDIELEEIVTASDTDAEAVQESFAELVDDIEGQE
jgi:predicted MFS family arabinose efflux permease